MRVNRYLAGAACLLSVAWTFMVPHPVSGDQIGAELPLFDAGAVDGWSGIPVMYGHSIPAGHKVDTVRWYAADNREFEVEDELFNVAPLIVRQEHGSELGNGSFTVIAVGPTHTPEEFGEQEFEWGSCTIPDDEHLYHPATLQWQQDLDDQNGGVVSFGGADGLGMHFFNVETSSFVPNEDLGEVETGLVLRDLQIHSSGPGGRSYQVNFETSEGGDTACPVPDVPPPPEEQNTVKKGELGVFTSPTEGVDFQGEFVYAVNIGGPGDLEVLDANFSDGSLLDCCEDGIDVFTEDRELPDWHTAGDYGFDTDLEAVMQSIRWSAAPAGIDVTFDVEPGTAYKLQLLFAESCCDRGFDILVEDEVAVENFNVQLAQGGINNGSQGVVYSLDGIVSDDDKLEIVLVGPNPSAPDNNPILNGVTLELGTAGVLGDFNGNSMLDAEDIDLLSKEVVAGTNTKSFDLNGDDLVNEDDRVMWVKSPLVAHTWFGDSNLDREFNSGDLVQVFAAGKYETEEAAGWAEGDWDGDGIFNSSDLVVAFADGGYEQGAPAARAVPEPSSLVLLLLGMIGLCRARRR